MPYQTLHTLYGLQRLAEAEATDSELNLTHLAVGDGNGSPTEPAEDQTQLVRERYRATVNRVYQSPSDPQRYTAELVIPASVGGFVIRELGVFDDAGGLCLVGNLPDCYKPVGPSEGEEGEGAFADTVVRVEFIVANASIITLHIDPNIAVATQAWIINNITAASLIPGGTVGQLLGKASNADGDYAWQDLDGINVTVDTIAEKQLLATDQTIVDLAATTTYGLAVYIDGLRLDLGSAAGEWQPDEAISTRLHLGQSYAAGTRITLVQNEPAGSAGAPLERAKNLADVIDKAAGRSNLDVFSRAETRQMAPPGVVAHFARSSAPSGWLKANGAAISRTAYADLFAAIGTTFGAGDGFNTFNLPDLRGEFMRGWDDARGVDAGRQLGSWQAGELAEHEHLSPWVQDDNNSALNIRSSSLYRGTVLENGGTAAGFRDNDTAGVGGTNSDDRVMATTRTGGAETRPRNVALLACIKF